MKRDWDLIREVLIKFEGLSPDAGWLQLNDFPSERAYEYSYHVELLMEAGLIQGEMSKLVGRRAPQNFSAQRLTWQGHEFLDAIRSDTVWKKTKTSFIKGGLSMTLELVKEVAKEVAVALLKTTIST